MVALETHKLILKRRTIRKFEQRKIDRETLLGCVNAARLAPSGANLQPIEYIVVTEGLEKVFGCTRWASYLDNGTPGPGERPVAYVVMLINKDISSHAKYDVGLAAGNIILTALERGIASCLLGALDRDTLMKILDVPGNYAIELVIALGYPKQESVEDELKQDVKYWLDEKGVLHVPKRKLRDILHEEGF